MSDPRDEYSEAAEMAFEDYTREQQQRKLKALALLALQVLDQQARYFRNRTKDDLILSKSLEKELRRQAQEIVKESLL